MKIGVLGTGIVGRTLGSRLAALGNEVTMGSRTADNEAAAEWARTAGASAGHGTFADAAAFGQVLINCTSGMVSLTALRAAAADNLRGKLLIDVSNPLDFSGGMPPTLGVSNTDSVGEQIQRAFPEARVVKTLNTINCEVMIAPDEPRMPAVASRQRADGTMASSALEDLWPFLPREEFLENMLVPALEDSTC